MKNNLWLKLEKPFLALAPMAGITDSAFRHICRENGADVVYTEMISIDALHYNSQKTLKMLEFDKKEKPVVIQLFGKRPELVVKAMEKVNKAGFDGVDLNFGCPAKKVAGHGGGVALLRNLDLSYELVRAVCENTDLPVSVKTRTSIKLKNSQEKITVLDFIEKINDLSVKALMLHGRSYEQGFQGEVDWTMLRKAREKFSGVFIANGGIDSPEKAKEILTKVKSDGLGLGRGVYGRPWLFSQIKDYLKKGQYSEPDLKKIKKTVLQQAQYAYKNKGDHGLVELRKHLCWYFRGFSGAAKMRSRLVRVESIKELKQILKNI